MNDCRKSMKLILKRITLAAGAALPILLMSLGLAIYTDSLRIPHNDAWSHSKIAQHFAETGEWKLLQWNRTFLIGQIYLLGSLGKSIVCQHLFTALLAAIGMLAAYFNLRRRVGDTGAFIGIVAISITPEFGLLSTSFMSDIPAFAGIMLTWTILDRYTDHPKWGVFLIAIIIALWATTVREQAIAAIATVAAIGIRTSPKNSRYAILLISLLSLIALVALELWRRSLPGDDPPVIRFSPGLLLQSLKCAAFSSGLYLLPVIALVATPSRWRRNTVIFSLCIGVLALSVAFVKRGDVFFGNYLTESGAYPSVLEGERMVIPHMVFVILAFASSVSLMLMAGHLVHNGLKMDLPSTLLFLFLSATTFGPSLMGQQLFSRYLLPLLPFMVFLLLSRCPTRNIGASLCIAAPLTVLGLLITANALSFDAARWKFAESFVRRGWKPHDVNAGMEWNGWHAGGCYRPDLTAFTDHKNNDHRLITIQSASQLPNFPLDTYIYSTFGFFGRSYLHASRHDASPSTP
jgi:hypothetical protein